MKLTAPDLLRTLTERGMRLWIETSYETFDRDRQRFYQAAKREFPEWVIEITACRAFAHSRFDDQIHFLLRIERLS